MKKRKRKKETEEVKEGKEDVNLLRYLWFYSIWLKFCR